MFKCQQRKQFSQKSVEAFWFDFKQNPKSIDAIVPNISKSHFYHGIQSIEHNMSLLLVMMLDQE